MWSDRTDGISYIFYLQWILVNFEDDCSYSTHLRTHSNRCDFKTKKKKDFPDCSYIGPYRISNVWLKVFLLAGVWTSKYCFSIKVNVNILYMQWILSHFYLIAFLGMWPVGPVNEHARIFIYIYTHIDFIFLDGAIRQEKMGNLREYSGA